MNAMLSPNEVAAMIAASEKALSAIQNQDKRDRKPYSKTEDGFKRRKERRAAIRAKSAWLYE